MRQLDEILDELRRLKPDLEHRIPDADVSDVSAFSPLSCATRPFHPLISATVSVDSPNVGRRQKGWAGGPAGCDSMRRIALRFESALRVLRVRELAGSEMRLQKTYHIEAAPEPAMEWGTYERIVLEEFEGLLARTPPPPERDMQRFLEKHPCLVPGAFNVIGRESGHYPWLCGVIAQPPLPSYDRRIPDFMWLSLNSDTEEPVLIEIEAPGKRWFTDSGNQTKHLTQALNQIAEWKSWFGVPHNIEAFKAFYGLDRDAWRRRRFRPAYVLIYGRRSEANAKPLLTQKRSYLCADDIIMMTYDRLSPNPKADQMICMKVDVSGSFTSSFRSTDATVVTWDRERKSFGSPSRCHNRK
jgi:Domain of unknown function (DUF4263)